MKKFTITIASLLLIRYLGSTIIPTVQFFISHPGDVVIFIYRNLPSLSTDFAVTMGQTVGGLVLSLLSTYILILITSYYPKTYEYIFPFFILSQIIPTITLAPLIVIIFGMGVWSKIIIASIFSFFPLFMSVYDGIHNYAKIFDDVIDTYQISTRRVLHHIHIPLALPSLFTGLQVAISASLIGSIVAEFSGSFHGLGKNLLIASRTLNADMMMASLIGIGSIGCILYVIVLLLKGRLLYRKT